MAPEQVAADAPVDHRADLYALGVIAYQLLSARPPFVRGHRATTSLRRISRERPAPSLYPSSGDVPEALERLVMSLLEKRPEDRPPTAAVVLAELDAVARWAGHRGLAAGDATRARHSTREREWRPSLAYFGRLAANWIADNLARTEFVDVVSDIVSRLDVPTATVAAESKARLVVAGSYFVDGDSIRAQLRVHDVSSGMLLPGSPLVSAPRATPSALLGPLGNQALVTLATRLDPRIAEWSMGAPPQNMNAYLAFIDGLDQVSAGNHAEAISQWQRAAELDETYMQPLLQCRGNVVRTVSRASGFASSSASRLAAQCCRMETAHGSRQFEPTSTANRRSLRRRVASHRTRGTGRAAAVRVHRIRRGPRRTGPHRPRGGKARQLLRRSIPNAVGRHDDLLRGHGGAPSARPSTTRSSRPRGSRRRCTRTSREIAGMALRAHAAIGDVASIESLLPTSRGHAGVGRTVDHSRTCFSPSPESSRITADPPTRSACFDGCSQWQRRRPIEATAAGGSHFDFARALYHLGEYDEARSMLASLIESEPGDSVLSRVRGGECREGRRRDVCGGAPRRLDRLERPFDHGETPYARALVAAQRGETARGVKLLRQSLQRGMPPDHVSIHADLMLSPLRGNTEFQQLLLPRD